MCTCTYLFVNLSCEIENTFGILFLAFFQFGITSGWLTSSKQFNSVAESSTPVRSNSSNTLWPKFIDPLWVIVESVLRVPGGNIAPPKTDNGLNSTEFSSRDFNNQTVECWITIKIRFILSCILKEKLCHDTIVNSLIAWFTKLIIFYQLIFCSSRITFTSVFIV